MIALSKLKGRSLAEIRTRGRQLLLARAELMGWASDAAELSASDLVHRAGLGDSPAPLQLLVQRLREGLDRGFPFDHDEILTSHSGAGDREATAALIARADRAALGAYDVLGFEALEYGQPSSWNLDPVSGKRAPMVHWSRVPYLDSSVVGDHKIIWELNRHQHFVTLAQAWVLTADERYPRVFVEQLLSWMEMNPAKLGINWASSLEVAFRSMSWLRALALFRGAAPVTDEILLRIAGCLYLHARHLERYLSTYFSPNTHLTGEALGLFHLGTLLPAFQRASVWRARGLAVLVEELNRQVRPDGVYFEQTTWYHRYTTDFYLDLVVLAERTGTALPPEARAVTERLTEHLMDIQRPDGRIPLVGDDDGGRLFGWEAAHPADVRLTMAVAAAVFARSDFARAGAGAEAAALWVAGPDRSVALARLEGADPAHLSRGYLSAGYYVMRDGWGSGANYAVVDCGPHGALSHGHAHADALSIEISVGGRPALVDPGTCAYVGAARNEFRTSQKHNTLSVDGLSQSVPAGPFNWGWVATSVTEEWVTHTRFDFLSGSHDGYTRLPSPAVHRRSVLFIHGGYWVILDELQAATEHGVTVAFQCAPGVVLAPVDGGAMLTIPSASGEPERRLRMATFGPDNGRVAIVASATSPAYGAERPAPAYRHESRGRGHHRVVTFLVPERGPGESTVRSPSPGEQGFLVESQGWSDTVLPPMTGVARRPVSGVESDAPWLWLRRYPSGPELTEVAAIGGTYLRLPGGTRDQLGGRRWATAVRDRSGWSVEAGSMLSGGQH